MSKHDTPEYSEVRKRIERLYQRAFHEGLTHAGTYISMNVGQLIEKEIKQLKHKSTKISKNEPESKYVYPMR